MTDKLRRMSKIESFDARINTDGLTITPLFTLTQEKPAPKKRPYGHCIYTRQATLQSTEERTHKHDIRL